MSSPGPGQILFTFVRHWSRRSQTAAPSGGTATGVGVGVGDGGAGDAEQGRLVLVTEAVNSLARRGAAATVNAVAHEIGIDQSGASRLVKSATEGGYLAMQASASDGRRRQATVTAAGHALLDHAHVWQEAVFDRLTEGWSERRRKDFASAMAELIERSQTLDR